MSSRRESGQAAVESALVLPLVIFLILGTTQLFMMMQARIMAEYAAFRATRAGSLNHGNCDAMLHAAIAAVLPTFARVDTPALLGQAFGSRKNNRFDTTELTNGEDISGEEIVWIFREQPIANSWGGDEPEDFDYNWQPQTLEVRLILWFPLRIPFADWVMTRALLAHYGMLTYSGNINPLSPAQVADWPNSLGYTPEPATMAEYADPMVVGQFETLATGGKYLFPIQATHAMRMMTPARSANFQTQNCPPLP